MSAAAAATFQDMEFILAESLTYLSSKLYSSAKLHASIALSLFNNTHAYIETPTQAYLYIRINAILGKACFLSKEIKRAVSIYESIMNQIRAHFLSDSTSMDPTIVTIIDSMLEHISDTSTPDLAISWALSIPTMQRSNYTLIYICQYGSTQVRKDACVQYLTSHPTAEEVLNIYFQLGGTPDTLVINTPSSNNFAKHIQAAVYNEYKCLFADANTCWKQVLKSPAVSYEVRFKMGKNSIRILDVANALVMFCELGVRQPFGIHGMDWVALAFFEAGYAHELRLLKDQLDLHARDTSEAKTVTLILNTIMKSWTDIDTSTHLTSTSPAYTIARAQNEQARKNFDKAQMLYAQLLHGSSYDLLVYRGILECICDLAPSDPSTIHMQNAVMLVKEMHLRFSAIPETRCLASRVLLNCPSYRDTALKSLHDLVRLNPTMLSAIKLLVRTYAAENQFDRAVTVIEDAKNYIPRHIYYYELAQVHSLQGNKQCAIVALSQVLQNDANHADAAQQLREFSDPKYGHAGLSPLAFTPVPSQRNTTPSASQRVHR